MTQEEKQLLLADLCARLPYRVKVQIPVMNDGITLTCGDISAYFFNPDNKLFLKPYLRPMSSMTEEEKEELIKNFWGSHTTKDTFEELSWYLSKHLDINELIPKCLAIEAPEGMYNLNGNK